MAVLIISCFVVAYGWSPFDIPSIPPTEGNISVLYIGEAVHISPNAIAYIYFNGIIVSETCVTVVLTWRGNIMITLYIPYNGEPVGTELRNIQVLDVGRNGNRWYVKISF